MPIKLTPDLDVDVWEKEFLDADPNRYRQFKNKTSDKKVRMAWAAYHDAHKPKKSK